MVIPIMQFITYFNTYIYLKLKIYQGNFIMIHDFYK